MYDYDQDGGRFYFQVVEGDAELIAKVEKHDFDGGSRARAGIMFREHNTSDAATVIFYRGSFNNNEPHILRGQYRTGTRQKMAWQNPIMTCTDEWIYLRLVRQGNVFSSYIATETSPDEWELYNSVTIDLPLRLNAGIFVSKYYNPGLQEVANRFAEVVVRQMVSVKQEGTDSLALSWEEQPLSGKLEGDVSYMIERGSSKSGPFDLIASELSGTTHADNTIIPGNTYYYRITAIDAEDTPHLIGTSAGHRVSASTNVVEEFDNGYWAEAYSDGAEFVLRGSGVAESELTSDTNAEFVDHPHGYTIYYSASVVVPVTDDYTLMTRFDDGGKVWLGDDLVIEDDLQNGTARTRYSAPLHLEAGRAYTLRVYHTQHTGDHELTLKWARSGDQSFVNIPIEIVSPMPTEWNSYDFGHPVQNGLSVFDFNNQIFTLTSGNGIEAPHHAYMSLDGDFAMQLHVMADSNSEDGGAGVLMRTGSSAESAFVGCYLADNALQLLFRESDGGSISGNTLPLPFTADSGIYLKIERIGDDITLFGKPSKNNEWQTLATARVKLPWQLYAGPAAYASSSETPFSARFNEVCRVGLTTALLPEADTMVQMGDADSNFGQSRQLIIKNINNSTTREVFMRFDTTGLAGVSSAKLRLYVFKRGSAEDADRQVLFARRITDNTWDENSVTWNNPPQGVVLPGGFISTNDTSLAAMASEIVAGEFIELDVTDAVRRSAAEGSKLSLELFTTAIYNHDPLEIFSRENNNIERRPYLYCYSESPLGLKAEPGALENEIALTWQPSLERSARFTIMRATSPNGPFVVIEQAHTGYTYYDSNLTPGTTYYYRIEAANESWVSSNSGVVSARCDAVTRGTQLPLADCFVQAGNDKDRSFGNQDLVAKNSLNDDTFNREIFLRFDVSGMTSVQNARLRLTPKHSSERPLGKTLLTTYLEITAFASDEWSCTTATWNNSPYGHPMFLRSADDLKPWPDQVERVRFRIGEENMPQEVDITPLVQRIARVSNTMTLNIYRVDNYNNNNAIIYSSSYDNPAYRPMLLYALQRPATPDATASASGVHISWPSYSGAISYSIERSAGGAESEYATIANGVSGTEFVDQNISTGTDYNYRVIAHTSSSVSEPSDPVAVRLNGVRLLTASADTAIDANNSKVSFGNSQTLNLKCQKSSPTRENFFRFDVRGMENTASARFRMNITATDIEYVMGGVVVYDATDMVGDWDEYTITWSTPPRGYTKPTGNTGIAAPNELGRVELPYRTESVLTAFIEVDASEAVRRAANAGKDLTILVCGDDMLAHAKAYFNVASRENNTVARRPVLICSDASISNPVVNIAKDAATRAVTISWWPIEGAQSYSVTRVDSRGVESNIVSDTSSLSITDSGLWNGANHEYTYYITANFADGTSGSMPARHIRMGQDFIRHAIADSFVQGGSNADTAFGTETLLGIKNDTSPETSRETFLRFALSELPEYSKAVLRVVPQQFNIEKDIIFVARAVPDSEWSESGIDLLTWNNSIGTGQPGTQAPLVPDINEAANRVDLQYIEVGDYIEFDITRLIQRAQATAEESLVIHLYSASTGSKKNFWLYSRESADKQEQPHILFSAPLYPPPATLLMLR